MSATINKLCLISVSLACSETYGQTIYLCRVLLSFFLDRSPCFPNTYFSASAWNLTDNTVLFRWFRGVFWSHKVRPKSCLFFYVYCVLRSEALSSIAGSRKGVIRVVYHTVALYTSYLQDRKLWDLSFESLLKLFS